MVSFGLQGVLQKGATGEAMFVWCSLSMVISIGSRTMLGRKGGLEQTSAGHKGPGAL